MIAEKIHSWGLVGCATADGGRISEDIRKPSGGVWQCESGILPNLFPDGTDRTRSILESAHDPYTLRPLILACRGL